MGEYSSININFGGKKPPLAICGIVQAAITPCSLFHNLTPDCKPIATKSRRLSAADAEFISREVSQLLADGIIEESKSSRRAQAFVVSSESRKKRMVIDYSRTINEFTELDAYPIPNIEKLVNEVARYSVFSTIDLKSAYHQVPILPKEKHYTAFEACGRLYQFCRIHFGVTNGVACFQSAIDSVIKGEKLTDTFAYLDVIIFGKDQEENDIKLDKFLKIASAYRLTINKDKCKFSQREMEFLGFLISNGSVRPVYHLC